MSFFNNLGEKGLKVSKKMAKVLLKTPACALKSEVDVSTAFVSLSPE